MSYTPETVEEIIARLSKDDKGGDPAQSTPPAQPFSVTLSGQKVTVNSPDELQSYLSQNDQQIRAAFEHQQAQLAAVTAELEKLQKKQKLNLGEPTPDVSIDPDEFVRDVVGGKPVDAVERAVLASPAIRGKLDRLEQLERKLALTEFSQRHPFYANEQVIGLLDKVRDRVGLGNSPEHYEAAAALAIQSGLLPDERVLRYQQQQAFQNQIQQPPQQAQQNQQNFNSIPNQPGADQTGMSNGYIMPPGMGPRNIPMAAGFGFNSPTAAPPPPSPSNSGSYPSQLESAITLANQGKLTGDDLRKTIELLSAQGQV